MAATISVGVRYYSLLRRHTGVQHEVLKLPAGSRLSDALEQAADSHGSSLRELLFTTAGELVSHLIVFCSGKLVGGDREDWPLADGDELMLFPVTSGG